jgi:hypothetical protein
MGNPFDRALAVACRSTNKLAGQVIHYQRGDLQQRIPLATKADTVFEVADSQGQPLSIEGTDWLVTADELVLSGSRITPRRSDRILVLGPQNQTLVYEVLERDNLPPFHWSDPGRTALRIHTKLIEDPPC